MITPRSKKRGRVRRVRGGRVVLTARDMEILALVALCREITIEQIARALGMSVDRCRRRLRALFDAGYVNFHLLDSRASTLVTLAVRGRAVLAERAPEIAARLRRPAPAIELAGVHHRSCVVDARLFAEAWGQARGTPLLRWANAGGDVAQELGLPAYHVEPDGVAEFDARPGGPRLVAVEVDRAATEPGSVLAAKLGRYARMFKARGLDRLWFIVAEAGEARARTIAALVSRYGLEDVVRVVSHAAIVKRPVVDIETRGSGAQRREAPNTVRRVSQFPEVSRDV